MNAIFGFFTAVFVSISSVFSPSAVAPTPTPTPVPQEYYQAKGETERYPYRVRYVLWIPKDGGEVNGEIKGYVATSENEICSVSFHGLYEGDVLTGDIGGVCTILFVKQKVAGTFTGRVNPQKRNLDGQANGNVSSVTFSEYVYLSLY